MKEKIIIPAYKRDVAGKPELRVCHGVSRDVVPQSDGRDGDEDEVGGVEHRPGRNSC